MPIPMIHENILRNFSVVLRACDIDKGKSNVLRKLSDSPVYFRVKIRHPAGRRHWWSQSAQTSMFAFCYQAFACCLPGASSFLQPAATGNVSIVFMRKKSFVQWNSVWPKGEERKMTFWRWTKRKTSIKSSHSLAVPRLINSFLLVAQNGGTSVSCDY